MYQNDGSLKEEDPSSREIRVRVMTHDELSTSINKF